MLFSEASGRKVVSTSTADTVGKIDDFVVDPAARSVVALMLKKTAGGDTLRWPAITAFGADAVTVAGAEVITDADEQIAVLSGKQHRLMKARVLNTLGDEMGTVTDVDFDPVTGEVTALHLDDEQVAGVRLIGIGSYAVVVHAT